jgi:transposase-like protein
MPAAKPPEFRRRAVDLARRREKPIAGIAHDLGIAESCLRRWLKHEDVDTGRTEGLTTDERAELVRLRRELRWRRWRSRSSSGPAPTSPGRTSSHNRVPAGP